MRRSERLGIAVSVVCLGLLFALHFPLPSRELAWQALGSDLRLMISSNSQMALLLTAAISLGVDTTMRSHPQHLQRSLFYTATYWPLPVLITITVLALLPSITWWGYQVSAIVLAGGLLTLIIFIQYQTVDEQGKVRPGPRLILNGLVYMLALICLIYLYGARLRSMISASGVVILCGALALGLLRDSEPRIWRVWLYASAIALGMGELTWALNYLDLDARVVGPFLLVCYYTLVGLGQQHLWQRLTRRAVIEYGLVAMAGLAGLAMLTR